MMPGHEKYKARNVLENHPSFVQVFCPLAEAIVMKDEQMQGDVTKLNEAQKIMKDLRQVRKSEQVLDGIERVMLLTADTPLLAFANHKDQERKYFATTYADEWSGFMTGWFRSWYICLHGCEHSGDRPKMTPSTCGTLIPSKLWPRKDEEGPLAK